MVFTIRRQWWWWWWRRWESAAVVVSSGRWRPVVVCPRTHWPRLAWRRPTDNAPLSRRNETSPRRRLSAACCTVLHLHSQTALQLESPLSMSHRPLQPNFPSRDRELRPSNLLSGHRDMSQHRHNTHNTHNTHTHTHTHTHWTDCSTWTTNMAGNEFQLWRISRPESCLK